jgi:hypothetical protein
LADQLSSCIGFGTYARGAQFAFGKHVPTNKGRHGTAFCSQAYQLASWRRPFAASAGDPAIATDKTSDLAIALPLIATASGVRLCSEQALRCSGLQ